MTVTATIPAYTGVVPNRSQPEAEFETNVPNFLNYIDSLEVPLNEYADQLNSTATAINTEVANAAASATASANSAIESQSWSEVAEGYANTANAVANYQGLWVNLTGAYSLGITVGHNDKTWRLDVDVADITLSEPGVSGDWTDVTPLTITQSPSLSTTTVTLNENSSSEVIITDYDSRLDYTATPVDSNIATALISGNTITITGGDITDNANKQTVVNVTAKAAGIVASDPVAITVDVIYVPIVADDAIQVVDFSGEELFNDGFDQV